MNTPIILGVDPGTEGALAGLDRHKEQGILADDLYERTLAPHEERHDRLVAAQRQPFEQRGAKSVHAAEHEPFRARTRARARAEGDPRCVGALGRSPADGRARA